MSVSKPRITIVGLGLIGSSIGLALAEKGVASALVGHDKDRGAANEARRRGAIDKAEWNLIAACEDSDLVILALPLDVVKDTLEAIGPYLKAGAVVMDTVILKEPVMAWAAASLPEQVHFVGGNPILVGSAADQRGTAAARADLFYGAPFCLVSSDTTDERAVQMATGLVAALDAKPLFLDATEHDGLLAGVEHLPVALSLTLLEMIVGQSTWRELRKLAGTSFRSLTHLDVAEAGHYSTLLLSNRANVMRWIDTFSQALEELGQALEAGDEQALTDRFEQAIVERSKWLQDREAGQLTEGVRQELPKKTGLMEVFLGSFWRRDSKKES